MTPERAAHLLAKWDARSRHDALERWGFTDNFWLAVDLTRRTLLESGDYSKQQLKIENEEQERKTCANGLNLSASSQQLRL